MFFFKALLHPKWKEIGDWSHGVGKGGRAGGAFAPPPPVFSQLYIYIYLIKT